MNPSLSASEAKALSKQSKQSFDKQGEVGNMRSRLPLPSGKVQDPHLDPVGTTIEEANSTDGGQDRVRGVVQHIVGAHRGERLPL